MDFEKSFPDSPRRAERRKLIRNLSASRPRIETLMTSRGRGLAPWINRVLAYHDVHALIVG